MATTIFDDNFVWRNYLDRMANTLDYSPILQSRSPKRAGQYANDLRQINPKDFEHEIHQRKVREVVLFIQGALKPAEPAPRIKELPKNMRFPRPNPIANVQPIVEEPFIHPPPVVPVSPINKRRKKRKNKKNRK